MFAALEGFKPITITQLASGKGYHMHVEGQPIVNTAPAGQKPALSFKGRPNYVEGAPAFVFKTKRDAEGIAHQVGRYILKLGDFVDSYVEYRKAPSAGAAEDCGCSHTHPPIVPSLPCPAGAEENVPVVYEEGAADAQTRVAEEAAPEATPAGCLPWVKVTRDPERYESCLQRAQKLGPIQTPEAVYNLLAPTLEKEDQEVFLVVLLDVRFNLRGVAEVGRGQRSRVGVGVNDVMRIVITSGAERFAVAHNHPSGAAKPSQADRDLTVAIEKACEPYGSEITFLDHCVVGVGQYYSVREGKLHKKRGKKA